MIGDWFEKIQWKQPFRYVDAVVWVGLGGVAVIGTAYWVLYGSPTNNVVEQSGYRGTGMAQIEFESEMAQLASINVMPESEEPYVPTGDEPLAKDVYENVQVLGNLTEDNFNRLMLAITEWVSPEQGCAYCHGEDGNFAHDDIYTKVVARRMIQMNYEINGQWQDHVGATGVNCYTCHRGNNVPQYIWFSPEGDDSKGMSAMYQNRPTTEAVYSSLPSNAIEAYLEGDQGIRVQPTEPRQANDTFGSMQQTELTYSLMMHMSDSLGVNCTYCHNSRAFGNWEQSPPQRVTAWYGIRMVRALNNDYLVPLGPTYPPHRLGAEGDAPKANCTTCHQNVAKPLYGAPAVAEWPELVSPDPVYEQETAAAD